MDYIPASPSSSIVEILKPQFHLWITLCDLNLDLSIGHEVNPKRCCVGRHGTDDLNGLFAPPISPIYNTHPFDRDSLR